MHILKTDDGPHSAEMWAHVTTQEILSIIQIEPTAPPSASIDKVELEVKLLRILAEGHHRIQDFERSAIEAKGDNRLSEEMHEREIVDDVVHQIIKATRGMIFESHFAKNSTSEFLFEVVANHFASSMHVERLWHTDRNPGSEHCRSYRAKFSANLLPQP